MDTGRPSLADAGTLLTEIVAPIERRSSPRTNYLTVVTMVMVHDASADNPPSVLKAHSEDISAGGAKLTSRGPLRSDRVYLRFLLPTHWERFVEAEVVSESIRECKSLSGRSTRQYVYGVRFTGVEQSPEEMRDLLLALMSSAGSDQRDDRE